MTDNSSDVVHPRKSYTLQYFYLLAGAFIAGLWLVQKK